MEALPFILLGSLVSSLIHIYVSDEQVLKKIPKSVSGQIFSGIFLAFFIPSCECGIVPVVKRLNAKGVPAPMAAAYMVSSPVVNPVVMLSTYAGFRYSAEMTVSRFVIAVITAVAVGFLFSIVKNPFIATEKPDHSGCSCCCGHGSRFTQILTHAREDFVQTLAYLIIGAGFAGAFHVLMPQNLIMSLSGSGALSIAVMMLFAVILSVCSEADSFVASSFVHFSPASMLGFVNIGPVFDLKLMMMYTAVMRKGVILRLVLVSSLIIYSICLALELGGFSG